MFESPEHSLRIMRRQTFVTDHDFLDAGDGNEPCCQRTIPSSGTRAPWKVVLSRYKNAWATFRRWDNVAELWKRPNGRDIARDGTASYVRLLPGLRSEGGSQDEADAGHSAMAIAWLLARDGESALGNAHIRIFRGHEKGSPQPCGEVLAAKSEQKGMRLLVDAIVIMIERVSWSDLRAIRLAIPEELIIKIQHSQLERLSGYLSRDSERLKRASLRAIDAYHYLQHELTVEDTLLTCYADLQRKVKALNSDALSELNLHFSYPTPLYFPPIIPSQPFYMPDPRTDVMPTE
ncbi:hypothetical protein FA13DRAFT_1715946 [Coprinellus micaceus]|uniref:Uncharacterized protein n=1 Tax=Coprinellus micaceus TaxID=71717 RepID=A0A4Y7SLB2_COPMI|nr:hypothetical protein FA13DRAFT_1715946 [Coprinellus micaceus]